MQTVTLLRLAILLSLTALCRAAYNLDYLADGCVRDPSQRVLNLGDFGLSTYGIVRLTTTKDYGEGLECALRIDSPPEYSLHVEIVWVDIYWTNAACIPDSLQISSSDFATKAYCGHGVPEVNSLIAPSGTVDVKFVSGYQTSGGDDGFELHYNVYRTNAACNSTIETQCPGTLSEWCVPSELTCDGRDNCYDGADEWNCGLSGGAIAAIVITSLLVGGTVIAFTVYIAYETRRKKNNERQEAAQTNRGAHPSTAAASVQYQREPNVPQYSSGSYNEPPPVYTFNSQYANPYMQEDANGYATITSPQGNPA